jgi:C4-dicarboxylate-specific signal transduction histidine kinase
VARDITRQTRLEAERAALRERLAQSEKLASLGQFVAGIAHEMNNPLQGVLGHLELLIELTEAARPVRKELKQIYQDADRAAKIVRNLLVFTGSRRMTRRRLQVDRVLTRVLASRRASLQRASIEVTREQAQDLPFVLGDPLLLQQALLNIVINAEHAIVEGNGARRIALACSSDASRERVSVIVRDSGPGIPADVLPRIFDPFFTTKEVGKGTGLGLAITYGIVQEHGGTITASNPAGGGAEFRLDLPSAEVGGKVSSGPTVHDR